MRRALDELRIDTGAARVIPDQNASALLGIG